MTVLEKQQDIGLARFPLNIKNSLAGVYVGIGNVVAGRHAGAIVDCGVLRRGYELHGPSVSIEPA